MWPLPQQSGAPLLDDFRDRLAKIADQGMNANDRFPTERTVSVNALREDCPGKREQKRVACLARRNISTRINVVMGISRLLCQGRAPHFQTEEGNHEYFGHRGRCEPI
jgi:hypothetical protein